MQNERWYSQCMAYSSDSLCTNGTSKRPFWPSTQIPILIFEIQSMDVPGAKRQTMRSLKCCQTTPIAHIYHPIPSNFQSPKWLFCTCKGSKFSIHAHSQLPRQLVSLLCSSRYHQSHSSVSWLKSIGLHQCTPQTYFHTLGNGKVSNHLIKNVSGESTHCLRRKIMRLSRIGKRFSPNTYMPGP